METEPEKSNSRQVLTHPAALDDRLIRAIGIPFFGLVIPAATGLINSAAMTWWETGLAYGCYILLAGIIWEGNRFLLFRNYPVIFRSTSFLQKYWLMLGLNLVFTTPVSLLFLLGSKWVGISPEVSLDKILITTGVIVVCVIFVTNAYEKVLFAKHTDHENMRMEQLERARVQSELEALRNQIDPHFMFNNLNSIAYLIDHDPVLAKEFVGDLADVYRYILRSKEQDLVLLQDEMDFMQSYASLIRIRHGDAFELRLSPDLKQHFLFLVPPVSLMVAVENAVKHNEVSQRHRLVIEIFPEGDQIVIRNQVQPRVKARESTRTGLVNLDERFRKTIGRGIDIYNSAGVFQLKLPIVKIQQ